MEGELTSPRFSFKEPCEVKLEAKAEAKTEVKAISKTAAMGRIASYHAKY
ncbi:MAG: hypothetical protein ACTTJZ_00180 [Sphaerochaetaceae bacterium]